MGRSLKDIELRAYEKSLCVLFRNKYRISKKNMHLYQLGEFEINDVTTGESMEADFRASGLSLKDFLKTRIFSMDVSAEYLQKIVDDFLYNWQLTQPGYRILGFNVEIVFIVLYGKPLGYILQESDQ